MLDEQLSGDATGCLRWESDDEYTAICEDIEQGVFKMATIKMAVLQITEDWFTIGMVSGNRSWTSGAYASKRAAKGAITRKLFRSGGVEYEQVTFDEYQAAVEAIGDQQSSTDYEIRYSDDPTYGRFSL